MAGEVRGDRSRVVRTSNVQSLKFSHFWQNYVKKHKKGERDTAERAGETT